MIENKPAKRPILYIVVPCYNEEDVLPLTSKQLKEKLKSLKDRNIISEKSKVTFVNDGSKDATWQLIRSVHESEEQTFSGVNLSRNRGHQNALLGGLMTVKDVCDVTISMDADLQDDINVIDGMLAAYNEGSDVVYGVRSARDTDTFFKKTTAEGFYKLMKTMGVDIVFNHADFRLMSRRALDGLSEFSEVNLFLRGLVPLVGYKSYIIEYERKERLAGESKYPLKKMLAFAFDGITSFSIEPIRIVTRVGIFFTSVGFAILLYVLYELIRGSTVQGWASILISLWIIGGVLMTSLGIVGEYVGKIYMESKRRPRYIVESFIDNNKNS